VCCAAYFIKVSARGCRIAIRALVAVLLSGASLSAECKEGGRGPEPAFRVARSLNFSFALSSGIAPKEDGAGPAVWSLMTGAVPPS
jgi:hypothetical protein